MGAAIESDPGSIGFRVSAFIVVREDYSPVCGGSSAERAGIVKIAGAGRSLPSTQV